MPASVKKRTARQHWRAVPLALIVATFLLIVPAVLFSEGGSADTRAESSATTAAETVTCEKPAPVREPELCRTITVGAAIYRYALFAESGPGDSLKELVVVDPGGPGEATLTASGIGRTLANLGIAEPIAGTGFIMVEEPWVTRPVPSGSCAQRSAEFLTAAKRGIVPHETGGLMKQSCASLEFGWSPERYGDVVAAISARHGAQVTAFAGSSFGAYRLAWLNADTRFDIQRAALSNPLLPELSAVDVMRHQAQGIARLIQDDASRLQRSVAAGEVFAAAASQLSGARTPDLAEMEMPDAAAIASLADIYLGNYGRGQLSLGRLAYYQELCAAGFKILEESPSPSSVAYGYRYLASLHSGCPAETPTRPSLLGTSLDLCITVSDQDAVIPYEQVLELLDATSVRISHSAHTDGSSLEHCSDHVIGTE